MPPSSPLSVSGAAGQSAVFDNTEALAAFPECNYGATEMGPAFYYAISFRLTNQTTSCGLGLFALSTLTLALRAPSEAPVAIAVTLFEDTPGADSTTPARVVATVAVVQTVTVDSVYYDLPLPASFAADASAGLNFAVSFSGAPRGERGRRARVSGS